MKLSDFDAQLHVMSGGDIPMFAAEVDKAAAFACVDLGTQLFSPSLMLNMLVTVERRSDFAVLMLGTLPWCLLTASDLALYFKPAAPTDRSLGYSGKLFGHHVFDERDLCRRHKLGPNEVLSVGYRDGSIAHVLRCDIELIDGIDNRAQ